MEDVEINSGDRFIAKSLELTFLYQKTVVPFTSTQDLVKCGTLGGAYRKGEKTEVKEIETEETTGSEN